MTITVNNTNDWRQFQLKHNKMHKISFSSFQIMIEEIRLYKYQINIRNFIYGFEEKQYLIHWIYVNNCVESHNHQHNKLSKI